MPRNSDSYAKFYVEGSGPFPMDMLRHDLAWPSNTTDAMAINEEGFRRIELIGYARSAITPARWLSFGWACTVYNC